MDAQRALIFRGGWCSARLFFFSLRADGSVDGTHFQENGARILASFVADELLRVPDFAAHARRAETRR